MLVAISRSRPSGGQTTIAVSRECHVPLTRSTISNLLDLPELSDSLRLLELSGLKGLPVVQQPSIATTTQIDHQQTSLYVPFKYSTS